MGEIPERECMDDGEDNHRSKAPRLLCGGTVVALRRRQWPLQPPPSSPESRCSFPVFEQVSRPIGIVGRSRRATRGPNGQVMDEFEEEYSS